MENLDFDLDFDLEEEMEAFDLQLDIPLTGMESRINKPKKFRSTGSRRVKFKNAQKAAAYIKLMEEGERYFALLAGNFIMGDFIEAFLVQNQIQVKQMSISSLSMSQENVDSLELLMDKGYVDKLDLILSSYFFGHERHKEGLIPYIYDQLDKGDRFQLAIAGTHTKNCLFETSLGNKYIIHGSANLRSSQCLEEMVFERSAAVYDWKKEWHDEILKKYKTINHEIRDSQLWETVNP